MLKVSAVADGRFAPDESKAVLRSDQHRLGPSPKAGDILISRANTAALVGTSAYVERDYPNHHLPDKLWRVVLADGQRDSVEWLRYALASRELRTAILTRATGTSGSMKNISQDALLAIQVDRPPYSEQLKIGRVIATWDAAIDQTTRLVRAKRRLQRGLMQQLLTGKRRFTNFGVQSWRTVHFGEAFTERDEIGRADLPLLSITADRGVISRGDVDRKDTSAADKRLYKRIAPGDVGYNTMRMWQGVSAVSELEGIISPAYTVCVPSPEVYAPFTGYLFKFPPIVHLFRRYSQGLVDDTLNLKFHHFAQIKVVLPPLEEQGRIAEVLATVDRDIATLQRLAKRLKEQKQGLMQKLLTGQVRVPV